MQLIIKCILKNFYFLEFVDVEKKNSNFSVAKKKKVFNSTQHGHSALLISSHGQVVTLNKMKRMQIKDSKIASVENKF